MNTNLLQLSLNQGKQFNTYQTKIKKHAPYKSNRSNRSNRNNRKYREGFTMDDRENMVRPTSRGYQTVLQNQKKNTSATVETTQKELQDLQQLQSQYDTLLDQYISIQQSIGGSSLDTINRTSSSNPYINKNIEFSDGTVCYVTAQGVARPYPSGDVYTNTIGKNGCPRANVKVDIPFLTSYVAGSKIPTNPSLIVGPPMTLGESCGQEGKNVYVSTLVNSVQSTYIGCFNDKPSDMLSVENDQRAMIYNPSEIGAATYEQCQQYALDNGYDYFGLQNYNATQGTSECSVSNDLTKIQQYGEGSIVTTGTYPLWWSSGEWISSSTPTGSNAQLFVDGSLVVRDMGGNYIFQTPKSQNCVETYSQTTNGDAGGNDIEYNEYWSERNCEDMCNTKTNCVGFVFNKEATQGCWLKSDVSNVTPNVTSRDTYKRLLTKEDRDACVFKLVLQTDGNMCIYQNGNTTPIWSTNTLGQKRDPNPNWVASKGKYGVSYLMPGQILYENEWIGSDDGSLRLVMEPGNLVLYTSNITEGCPKNGNNKATGGPWVNAVYKLDSIGDKSVLGDIAYIDANAMLRPYPSSMLGYSDEYQIYEGADSGGNDIGNMTVADQSACQVECSNNADCAAYVFQPTTNTCWTKNSNAYPKGAKTANAGLTLGVRKPIITAETNCGKSVVDIDSVQYANYMKGDDMSPDTQCNVALVSQEDRTKFEDIQNQMMVVAQDIATKMESLYQSDNTIYEKMNMNADEFNKKLEMYKKVNGIIHDKQYNNSQKQITNNNIEGMKNNNTSKHREGMLSMADVNGMLSNTDLMVLQENYTYIFWSILAVGILTVTLNKVLK